jgi:hypothetical protein
MRWMLRGRVKMAHVLPEVSNRREEVEVAVENDEQGCLTLLQTRRRQE